MTSPYRTNSPPPKYRDHRSFWDRYGQGFMVISLWVVILPVTLFAVIGGTAVIMQFAVEGFAGHSIASFPHYCALVLVIGWVGRVFRPRSK
jgi:hypothetical protein